MSYESYKKINVLGKGSFGKAFLVQCASDGVSNPTIKLIFNIFTLELSSD